MKKKPATEAKFTKKEVVVRFAMSGLELSLYIVSPMIAGYYLGRSFGPWGSLAGLMLGSVAGLYLAVKRALKMTV